MHHFDDMLSVDLGGHAIRFVSYSGVRRRGAQGLENQAPPPPLPKGVGYETMCNLQR
jgi:hypothetical protein